MRFLCIDPAWEGGTPPDELLEGYAGVRFAVFPDSFDHVAHYLNMGKMVQLVVAAESGPVEQYADWFATDDEGLAEWFRSVVFWVIGNEMDGGPPSSWIMTPDEYAELWDRARCLHGERWIGGLCSGDVWRGKTYWQPDAAGVMVHLYGVSPRTVGWRLAQYVAVMELPVWVGEWHEHPDNSPLEPYWRAFDAAGGYWANYFCYSNAMVTGLGLEDV